jgi:tripartite-type tricarboxylate transporter receptor subunit TctC
MITKLELWQDGAGWWAAVRTDTGGDQTYGPYAGRGAALAALRGNVVEAFDEEWDEAKVVEESPE